MSCTEKCWTPVACPDHGGRMYPSGRSAGIEAYHCCDNYADSKVNPRHLWDEHDSTRWYTDPEGWNAHEATCKQCRGDEMTGTRNHPERNQQMSLNAYRDQCGKAAVRNGWHDRYLDIDIHGDEVLDHLVAKTALISCEVSEAIEELRSGHTPNEVYESAGGKPEGYPTELADIIIRTLDLAYMLSIDIDAAVQEKLAFNTTRGHKHGKTI